MLRNIWTRRKRMKVWKTAFGGLNNLKGVHFSKYFDILEGDIARKEVRYILSEKSQWPEPASEIYRPSDRRLSKLVPTFTDRECHMVSVTDPNGRILGFLDRILTDTLESLEWPGHLGFQGVRGVVIYARISKI
jgi:hypothetical protein